MEKKISVSVNDSESEVWDVEHLLEVMFESLSAPLPVNLETVMRSTVFLAVRLMLTNKVAFLDKEGNSYLVTLS